MRALADGQTWVGSATNLDTIWNRITFSLKQGNHRSKTLQAKWNEVGSEGVTFEIVETIEEETNSHLQFQILKERAAAQVKKLNAEAI